MPDERLQKIGELLKPPKLTPATIEFVDIAGLVKGASKGEGLGNKFLAHIRESHLLLHLLRNFSDGSIPHVYEKVDPERDMEIVNAELAITDLEIVERNLNKLTKEANTSENQIRLHVLEKIKQALSSGFESPSLSHEEAESIKEMGLFITKPIIYVMNCSDSEPIDLSAFPRLKERDVFYFQHFWKRRSKVFLKKKKEKHDGK